MILRLLGAALVLTALLCAVPASAEGPQFNGNCGSFTWTPNTEPDLGGYEIWDRTSIFVPRTFKGSVGPQVNSIPCPSLGFNAGQHYSSITAFSAGGQSPFSPDVPFTIVRNNQINDLRVTIINATDVTLAYTEVDDGTGAPATMDIRFATPTIDWGTSVSVTSGTCGPSVPGTAIGATRTCTVTGLSSTTPYQFQGVPRRGTLGLDAVFGPLTNIASGTTGGSVPPDTDTVTLASDEFTRANNVDLGPSWIPIDGLPWNIVGNAIRTPGAGYGFGIETNTAPLPDHQWAKAKIKAIAGAADIWVGVTLRGSLTQHSSYQFLASRGAFAGSTIGKRVNGAATTLVEEFTTTWAATDELFAEADGDVLKLYRNGVLVLTAVDSQLTSGYAGVWGYIGATTSNMEIEEWSAGGYSVTSDPCGCN